MDKVYEINRVCYINQENPTPSREDRDIAINIVPVRKNNDFENFVLAIDNDLMCCEDFRAEMNAKEGKYFVKRIAIDVELSENLKKEFDIKDFERFNSWEAYSEKNYFAIKVETDKEDIYAFVSNYHNGYYAHTIYYSNDELKLDVLETELL